jgi:hypothetical protein
MPAAGAQHPVLPNPTSTHLVCLHVLLLYLLTQLLRLARSGGSAPCKHAHALAVLLVQR